jgi:hypothetical protein
MKLALTLLALSASLSVHAVQPKFVTLRAAIDPYPLDQYPQGSNAVIVIYKSTSLGTTWTPFKPTAIFPAGRSNQTIQVLAPATYRFYATCRMQPYGESIDTSNVVTNQVDFTGGVMMQPVQAVNAANLLKAVAVDVPSRWQTPEPSKIGHRDFFDRNRNRK